MWSLRRRLAVVALVLPAACGRYRDFTLPPLTGGPAALAWTWKAASAPVLGRGKPGEWDAVDVLNPSVFEFRGRWLNLYSGFDGAAWHTGLAISNGGASWQKAGRVLSPDARTWEGRYIAANGSAIVRAGAILYFYQAGDPPRIGLARSADGLAWTKRPAPVLPLGPYASWDERGVADPFVMAAGGRLFLFYTGMDRARRQRLGVAESEDGGGTWRKLRTNPVLELGEYGAFDANGLGEPAVWAARGAYWMLYTGRGAQEHRQMGMARSPDGVHWEKRAQVFAGGEAWDSKVICDPSVMPTSGGARVWFGGGDVARPDENIHGQIGEGVLRPEGSGE